MVGDSAVVRLELVALEGVVEAVQKFRDGFGVILRRALKRFLKGLCSPKIVTNWIGMGLALGRWVDRMT